MAPHDHDEDDALLRRWDLSGPRCVAEWVRRRALGTFFLASTSVPGLALLAGAVPWLLSVTVILCLLCFAYAAFVGNRRPASTALLCLAGFYVLLIAFWWRWMPDLQLLAGSVFCFVSGMLLRLRYENVFEQHEQASESAVG